MYTRSVVPIFDQKKTRIVGFTGRSIFEKCKKCNYYHNQDSECKKAPKWYHDFYAESSLFNSWNIENGQETVFLTESIGNVLKLEEAGFSNALALYGSYISSKKLVILNRLGVMNIIYIKDSGEAGEKVVSQLRDSWYNYFNIIVPNIDIKDDIVELPAASLREELIKYV